MGEFINRHLILGVINPNHNEESCILLIYQLKILIFSERALSGSGWCWSFPWFFLESSFPFPTAASSSNLTAGLPWGTHFEKPLSIAVTEDQTRGTRVVNIIAGETAKTGPGTCRLLCQQRPPEQCIHCKKLGWDQDAYIPNLSSTLRDG